MSGALCCAGLGSLARVTRLFRVVLSFRAVSTFCDINPQRHMVSYAASNSSPGFLWSVWYKVTRASGSNLAAQKASPIAALVSCRTSGGVTYVFDSFCGEGKTFFPEGNRLKGVLYLTAKLSS